MQNYGARCCHRSTSSSSTATRQRRLIFQANLIKMQNERKVYIGKLAEERLKLRQLEAGRRQVAIIDQGNNRRRNWQIPESKSRLRNVLSTLDSRQLALFFSGRFVRGK